MLKNHPDFKKLTYQWTVGDTAYYGHKYSGMSLRFYKGELKSTVGYAYASMFQTIDPELEAIKLLHWVNGTGNDV
jgi:hypothetical protein